MELPLDLVELTLRKVPRKLSAICGLVCSEWLSLCPTGKLTTGYLADQGHLELLQWARSQGCPWDRWICARAAGNGRLDIIKWAREQGCPE